MIANRGWGEAQAEVREAGKRGSRPGFGDEEKRIAQEEVKGDYEGEDENEEKAAKWR